MAVKKKVAAKTSKKTAGKKKATAQAETAKPKLKSIAKRQTKLQVLQAIADDTGLGRKQVAAVFTSLGELMQSHMQKPGSGEFSIPDTGVKIRRVRKPATKARTGRNPATGEQITIAAKPAHNVVRLSALKALKDTLV
jgi:nucleoid DNA-binding protein